MGGSTFDLYSEITRKITDMLDKGIVPWRSPILGRAKGGMPRNMNTGKPYRGVNVFLLAFTAYAAGYESSYWITYNQARGRGGHVKKGEKSSMVVFWKPIEITDEQTKETKKAFVLRYYSVFNLDQCEGIDKPDVPTFTPSEFKPVEAAERIVKGYTDGPVIDHGGSQAFYRPSIDTVKIPEPTRFNSTDEYFSTLFHELSHSTGHTKRLNRKLDSDPKPFGSPDYAQEELVAEMSAAFLCGEAGIQPAVIENQAAYISGWLGKLKADKKLVIHAAGAAAKSADWILGARISPGQGGGSSENEDHVPHDETQASAATLAYAGGPDRERVLVDAARGYIRRGFAPVPVPPGMKAPAKRNWQDLRMTETTAPHAFHRAGNIGLLLGEPSGHLVDVDLDCQEARDLADRFLPPTDAITGRPSSPRSHRWYIAEGAETHQRRDPTDRSSIVEIRSTGAQTLVGPSVHPSGEPYDRLDAQPAEVDAAILRECVDQLADEVIRMRHGILPSRETPQPRELHHQPSSDDHNQLLNRATAYLDAMPPAISGQGGHNATFHAATALVHGFGLSPSETLDLLVTRFNPRCSPAWSDKELEHKVADAAKRPHTRPFGWLRDGAKPLTQAVAVTTEAELLFR
jgi:antirestriction protein ArdC